MHGSTTLLARQPGDNPGDVAGATLRRFQVVEPVQHGIALRPSYSGERGSGLRGRFNRGEEVGRRLRGAGRCIGRVPPAIRLCRAHLCQTGGTHATTGGQFANSGTIDL